MKPKDKRLSELMHWVLEDARRQNIPTIKEHAIKRYKIKEDTAMNYTVQIMIKLGKLSQPIKLSELRAEFVKASELDG